MNQAIEWGPLAQPPHSQIQDTSLPWRDNAWLLVMAPDAGVFGTVHVSTSPNAEARRAQCNLMVGGRPIRIVEPLQPAIFQSKSITYDLEGLIEIDHPELRMSLRLRPRFVLGDYTVSKVFVPLDERRPLQHFQQGIDIEGHVETSAMRTDLAGNGFRDRTWGYRDETAHVTEYAALIACFDDFDLTVMKFDSPTGMRTQGFLLGSDVTGASEMTLNRDTYGFFHSAELHVGQQTLTITGEPLNVETWLATGETGPWPSLQVHDEFLRLSTSTGATGVGVLEEGILHKVC
jgi:hypothetical protein